MSTQEERKAETRALLVAAASDLFARKGFHAVSAEAVADAAGRTTGALYSHFGGKEGLLLALLEEWKEQTAADIVRDTDTLTDLDDRLATVWRDFSSPPDERGDSWLLLEHELWLYAARQPEASDALAARYADARRNLADGLGGLLRDEGSVARSNGDALAALVIALLLGLEMQRRVDPASIDDTTALAGLRALIDGIATRNAPRNQGNDQ